MRKHFSKQNKQDIQSLVSFVKKHNEYRTSVKKLHEVFGSKVILKSLYAKLRTYGIGRFTVDDEITFINKVREYEFNENKTTKSEPITISETKSNLSPFAQEVEVVAHVTEPMHMSITDIQITDEGVNARDLHKSLGLKSDFSTWIKKELVGLVEDIDYMLLHKKMEQVSGAKHVIDYIVTIDVAKSIAMMQRNDKGQEVRNYFIAKEKEMSAPATTGNPLVDALVSMQLEQNKLNSRMDAIEVKLEDVVALPASKPVRTIPTGYTSVSSYSNKRPGLSRDIIKLIISLGSIGTCVYDKVVEGYGVTEETGYNIYDLDVIANRVISEAVRISSDSVYFTTPMLGSKRFQISF